jgi:DnaK suppressor protein
MNDKQMAFFRLKLQELKRGILENAGETTEHLREDTVVVPDPADRATIEEEHALELRTRDRERKLLKKIEQSIQRIDCRRLRLLRRDRRADRRRPPAGPPDRHAVARGTAAPRLKQKMFGD